MKELFVCIIFLISGSCLAQSFSDEKTSAINFINRVYYSSPFNGAKMIEGEEGTYYVVAVSLLNIHKDSILTSHAKAQIIAQEYAELGFAEPCVKFEMVNRIENGNQNTYLFFCTTLDDFISDILKRKIIDGARIVSAPGNKYIIASITMDNAKYNSDAMRDKAAFMKAKQHVNTMINGSTITSEQILRTDENDSKTEITNTEIVREHAMGFIQGLELLFAKEFTQNKTTYVYYSKF